MFTTIHKSKKINESGHAIYLFSSLKSINTKLFSKDELEYIKTQVEKNEQKTILINRLKQQVFVLLIDEKKEKHATVETVRAKGATILASIKSQKIAEINILNHSSEKLYSLALAEGLALANYQFLKYKTTKAKSATSLKKVNILDADVSEGQITELQHVIDATLFSRDLVNEPVSFLSAPQLSKEIEKLGKQSGFKVEVLSKAKIEALKMGGLLAVNKGSVQPPTFTILEWKPKNASNKKPIVLVGKGVVYDTGGYNIKVGTGMETMKCDMAGAAAVAGTLYAVAKNKLNVHVIGLIPATDNRVDSKAYVAGDVITMHSGKTVEVLNTDAEGRLILGDALSYAKKYNPELVIDLATLTGAAMAAIGKYGIVAMGNADDKIKNKLKESGNVVYERLAEFPFWEEYGDLIKSDIAEIKNLGGPYGGAITAGKFLEHFVDYPWMHFDIAGPAFLEANDAYRTKGGTGTGVRLLYHFLKNNSK